MKLLTIIEARPQFIKAAAVSRAFSKIKSINEIIIHTGQHFDKNMSEIFFKEMEIPQPAYNLNINSLNHGAMTGRMLEGIEEIIVKEKADMLMVYGDTNSTIAGALAAKKLHVPVAHVEAGLRSFNMRMPEEVNRILTDRISDLLFCPTDKAIENLTKEGFSNFPSKIVKSGDVMQDAALYYSKKSEKFSRIIVSLSLSDFILCTIHRAENTDNKERLNEIVKSINEINSVKTVVIPLHPRTCKLISDYGFTLQAKVIDPVGYFDMIELLKNCALVITDSGGLQKEAFFFKKHCVTLRDETEWVELTNGGFNKLAGANYNVIVQSVNEMLKKNSDFSVNLYGGGKASEIIAEEMASYKAN